MTNFFAISAKSRTDQAGAASLRVIRPLAIMYSDHVLTILAWCCLRDDFRMFRVDRIESLSSNGASFRPRRVSLLREYLTKLSAREENAASGMISANILWTAMRSRLCDLWLKLFQLLLLLLLRFPRPIAHQYAHGN